MSTSVTIKQEPSSPKSVLTKRGMDLANTPDDVITFTSDLDDSDIKLIPLAAIWPNYVHNSFVQSYTENEWKSLPEATKYDELILLKPNPKIISSPSTQVTINVTTDDKTINTIPKKDCKLLLSAYAHDQGFPHLISQIDSMLVSPLRAELIKARDQLNKRTQPSPISTHKKTKQITLPFVLTHATSDDDINTATEESLLSELKSMHVERNLYDSVMWDSLNRSNIIDMIQMERNEMLGCFTEESGVPSSTKGISPEVINILDDSSDESSDEDDSDTEMEDVANEADKFVKEELDQEKKKGRTLQFEFGWDTPNDQIFSLNRRRALKIVEKIANSLEETLPESFIQEATLDDLHSYIVNEREEKQFQREYTLFKFGPHTPDNDIMKLTRVQLENFHIYHYRDTQRDISDDHFFNKTDVDLKHSLISARDDLRNKDPTFQQQQQKNATNPKQPSSLPRGLHAKRQNLNGWNSKSAMTPVGGNLHNTVFHPNQNEKSEKNLIPLSKNYFYIRASISTEGHGSHIPTIARKFMKALRNSDSTFQLHPFDSNSGDINNILDSESIIPDDPTEILTWLRGLSSTKRRIHFSMRASNTCKLSELRSDIFGWCKTNRCYIDMDFIASENLFSCGWICGVHPRLYNRNELKEWLDKQDPEISKKTKIYPRTIFTVGDDGVKTITNAIMIDGSLEDSKEVMQFLYNVDWGSKYKKASFVPFRTSESLTLDDQKTAMEYHNDYLNSTYRKLVRIANPTKKYECESGEIISFREWLCQGQLHNECIIEGVETMKDGLVRIIYNKQHQKGVDFIIQHLEENVLDAFGKEIATDMLGTDFSIVSHINSEMEKQHATKIKAAWTGKQLTHVKPPQQKHTLFFGSNKSENLYSEKEKKSYSKVAQSNNSHSDEEIAASKRENADLKKMIEELQSRFTEMENRHQHFATNLKASIKSELLKEFGGIIEDLKKEMTATISTIEAKFDKYEINAIARKARMNQNSLDNFRTVAGELMSQQTQSLVTPSETSQSSGESLRGGAK